MRKLVVLSFVTHDGVMQAPGGPKHGGWVAGYWDGVMEKVMDEQMRSPYDLLLGRKTYELFAAHWPNAKDDPFADRLNTAKKYVVSTKPRKLDWNNSTLVTGDIPEEIRKLKSQNGPELQVHGSSNLI